MANPRAFSDDGCAPSAAEDDRHRISVYDKYKYKYRVVVTSRIDYLTRDDDAKSCNWVIELFQQPASQPASQPAPRSSCLLVLELNIATTTTTTTTSLLCKQQPKIEERANVHRIKNNIY